MKIIDKKRKMISNQELLEKCKCGDSRAQMKVYELYYKAMYNTSLQIVRNPVDAEDIMQEAFLKAFKLLPGTELQAGFGGWLKKIVINKSLDLIRSRKVYFEEIDNQEDDPTDKEYNWDHEENVQERVRLVREAIDQLPEKYRVVLSLNLLEGYDHDEISNILGITASTSRAQLSRGKRKLQDLLN